MQMDDAHLRIEQLEKELAQSREDMRSITEDQEATNEELQSGNEELLSSTEEMQSLNEELETSKEELQSTNEELIIVNQELIDKQELLNSSRVYAEAIVTTVREPLVVLDKTLCVKTANASFYKKFNITQKETEGKLFFELQNHRWDNPLLRSLLENILPQKTQLNDYEVTIPLPPQNECYMLLNARQIVNEKTAEELILLSIEDITEKRIAEIQLKEKEERFHQMADMMPQIVWTATPMGIIDYYNKQWYEFTGNEISYGDQSWKPILYQEDAKRYFETFYNSIETGIAFEIEFRFSDKTNPGSCRWFLGKATPIKDTEGNILKWIGTWTDIEEQKNLAEEKFILEFAEDFASYESGDQFFESLINFLAIKTDVDYVFIGELKEKDGKFVSLKTRALSFHGNTIPNIEHLLPDGICDQVKKGKVYSYPRHCRKLFGNNQTIVKFNVEGYVGYPLFDSGGKPIGLVGVMHEKEISNSEYISALLKIIAKRAEFELERNNFNDTLTGTNQNLISTVAELQRTNMQLDQFAYIASHDLQEPLRKILTFSNRLQDKYKDEFSNEAKTLLKKIEVSSTRMSKLINDLLNYSHLINTEKQFSPTDLNEILKNILNDFELLIEQKNAKIKSDILPVIEAIPMQMNQLFYNLISNGLKFAKEGVSSIINITSRTLTETEIKKYPTLNGKLSYCEITFADNGIGFDQKYVEQIFIIFQRLNQIEKYEGTGIGLAVIKKIVESHHGKIMAEAKENDGATFHLIFPIRQTIPQ